MGNLLAYTNDYSNSLHYLNIAKKEIIKIEDPVLYSKLYNEFGRNYFLLKLYKRSNEKLNKANSYIRKIRDKNQQICMLSDNYLWKWSNFNELNNYDSLHIVENKLFNIEERPFVYIKFAEKYLKEKKCLDSAEYYLQKSIILNINKKYPIDNEALALMNLGKLYLIKKDYNKAVDYYFRSLSILQNIKNQ